MHHRHHNSSSPHYRSLIALIVMMMFTWSSGHADEVSDAIEEGLKAYKEKDFSGASESLMYATQLIRQQKSKQLQTLLPEAPSGWTADPAKDDVSATSIMGGAVTAERRYKKSASNVTVTLTTDSPMLQSMAMMFANPMIAASGGARLTKIKRNTAIVKHKESNQRGEVTLIVDNQVLVSVKGSKVSEQDLLEFAEAIDYKALKNL